MIGGEIRAAISHRPKPLCVWVGGGESGLWTTARNVVLLRSVFSACPLWLYVRRKVTVLAAHCLKKVIDGASLHADARVSRDLLTAETIVAQTADQLFFGGKAQPPKYALKDGRFAA